jgi:hypothetical protein
MDHGSIRRIATRVAGPTLEMMGDMGYLIEGTSDVISEAKSYLSDLGHSDLGSKLFNYVVTSWNKVFPEAQLTGEEIYGDTDDPNSFLHEFHHLVIDLTFKLGEGQSNSTSIVEQSVDEALLALIEGESISRFSGSYDFLSHEIGDEVSSSELLNHLESANISNKRKRQLLDAGIRAARALPDVDSMDPESVYRVVYDEMIRRVKMSDDIIPPENENRYRRFLLSIRAKCRQIMRDGPAALGVEVE